tara:strand:+ start:296 stop:748 length:453 start_codon:yes stop_codon:yes gene_type:complete
MTKAELREKIRAIIPTVYKAQLKSDTSAIEYDELTKFPELKAVIVDLLTSDFDSFLSSIDWVAPKPTTFRINLKNGQEFYLTYTRNSFIAQVEGKKYYLLNLPEEQRAVQAIARILRYGSKTEDGEGADVSGAEDLSVDVEVDDTEATEV